VRNALKQRGEGLRWLEIEAGLARGAATKILDGKQQTSNHVDAISKVLGLAPPAVAAEAPDEAELLAIFRGMTPEGKVHLLGLLRLLKKPEA
jgi:lambda repressor-like predicted transcriptional regulator